MMYRKLDENGDYIFGRGSLDFYKDDPEAVAQAITTRLRLWLAEWFLDLRDGMPWNEQVLGTNTSRLRDAAIRRRILGTYGVHSIIAYKSNVNADTRTLLVEVAVETIYGQFFLSGTALYSGGSFSPLGLSIQA